LKSAGPRLVPFLKSAAIFFILFPEKSPGHLLYLLFKCIPICCLIGFVISHGLSLSDAYAYNRRILIGLCFSLLGDIALVFDGFFLFGMCLLVAVAAYLSVFPRANSVLMRYVGLVYTALIFVMFWRAVARVRFEKSLGGCTSLAGAVGAALFVVSDFCIAVNKFVTPLPHANAVIMSTYYGAQLGIAFSVLDSQLDRVVSLSAKGSDDDAQKGLLKNGNGFPGKRVCAH
uniref:lysoplasmalogenase n=1 Tax=Macrostomum lignano TaxID=282301 RepID=A0A1I8HBY5_9PLAT